MTHCRACFTPLPGEPAWKTLCKSCFITAKKEEQEALREEVFSLRDQVAMLRSRSQPAIDPSMLRTLVQLCHPDKHNGSEAANKATQWLLEQRRSTGVH